MPGEVIGGVAVPEAALELTTDDLNAAWRAGLGFHLTGADKASIAACVGVSVRTVQRWTTQAGQRRNPFPAGLTLEEYAASGSFSAVRLRFTLNVLYGLHSDLECGTDPAAYREHFGSICDAVRFMQAMEDGELDPWVSASYMDVLLLFDGEQWVLLVTYCRDISPKLK
ncbi:MAG: hypothetical protein ACRETH_07340 [Steroidobacteraceae bacterium]